MWAITTRDTTTKWVRISKLKVCIPYTSTSDFHVWSIDIPYTTELISTCWYIEFLWPCISIFQCFFKRFKVIVTLNVLLILRISYTNSPCRTVNFLWNNLCLDEINAIFQSFCTRTLNTNTVINMQRLVQNEVSLIKSEASNTIIILIRRVSAGKILPHIVRSKVNSLHLFLVDIDV